MKLLRAILVLAAGLIPACSLSQPIAAPTVVGKVVCGYQGWFYCYGDGSPVASWRHWSQGSYMSNTPNPATGAVTFELYPDVTSYAATSLFQTGLASLGNGEPAKLFSSYKDDVIQQHFKWMEDNGIDGVVLQRWLTTDMVFMYSSDSVIARVRRAAEKHTRMFYINYDISGLPATQFDSLKSDWTRMVNDLKVTSSPSYAYEGGKPVVAIWGFGFTDRPGTPAQCTDIINWFQSHGCYVIGGVPTNWRTGTGDSQPGFETVYQSFNMISPWTVGRYVNPATADDYKNNNLLPDRDYCAVHGMDYQPVIFPGFAWSNWMPGSPNNEIPRAGGSLLWRQAYNIQKAGIPSAYVAMFDEYDEGTAIAPAADSYLSVPTNQYFLTTSADGNYFSPDFYMRLTGELTRMIEGQVSPSLTFATEPSSSPFYFRTSVETGFDAMPTWLNTIDETTLVTNVKGNASGNIPVCEPKLGSSYSGRQAIWLAGQDNSTTSSFCYYKVFDVNIPVISQTHLFFRSFPENENGRFISVDLIMTDNTTLRDSQAKDVAGTDMHPAAGRGTVGQWSETICKIGNWISGKIIDRIVIGYDHGPDSGPFSGSIDDIRIEDSEIDFVTGIALAKDDVDLSVYPNPVSGSMIRIEWHGTLQPASDLIRVYTANGQLKLQQTASFGMTDIAVSDWPAGLYIVCLSRGGKIIYKKLVRL